MTCWSPVPSGLIVKIAPCVWASLKYWRKAMRPFVPSKVAPAGVSERDPTPNATSVVRTARAVVRLIDRSLHPCLADEQTRVGREVTVEAAE